MSVVGEYFLEKDQGGDWMYGNWMYGKVCFWIAGSPVGHLDVGTSLRDLLFSIERIRCDRGRGKNPRFDTMSAEETFAILDGALFGSGNPAHDQIANDEQWSRKSECFGNASDSVEVCRAYLGRPCRVRHSVLFE